jgi:MoaA/NifB/PqqE/SkfB family radical SAM enzyme
LEQFDIAEYMSGGIENIVKGVLKASIKNPKETAFKMGENIPAFLIASITSSCNLYCKGCYARANNSCGEENHKEQLSIQRWEKMFEEAKELGISFILLAGGEPLLRREIIEKAANVKEIMFPVFTNGTLLTEEYLKLFDQNRNLVPILSIEGDRQQTDGRRGEGTYDKLLSVMDRLRKKGILYGASVTVTTENVNTVTSKDFFDGLYHKGCKALLYIEYVPVTKDTDYLAPSEKERDIVEINQNQLRQQYEDVVFLSFPGDEKYTGGCLAAGRAFFHIGVDGAAEPCPFSPYSDMNLKDVSLKQALNSPLFRQLKETGLLYGGCLLFQKENEVKRLLASNES